MVFYAILQRSSASSLEPLNVEEGSHNPITNIQNWVCICGIIKCDRRGSLSPYIYHPLTLTSNLVFLQKGDSVQFLPASSCTDNRRIAWENRSPSGILLLEVVHCALRKERRHKMLRYRNFWIYSVGLAIVWAVVLILALMIRGSERSQPILLVFGGFCIGWVSTTIARYVYPPPKRWGLNRRQE